jgi:PH (Pleckstrin Homology) domain-containing protein
MLTDASLPQAFQAVRDKDEKFLWVGMPARVPFLVSGIPFLVLGCIWGSIDYFGFIRHMGGPHGIPLGFAIPFFALHLFPFWGSILNMVRLTLVVGNTYYAVTSRRLMFRSGFWGTDFKSIDFDQIVDLEVNVNPIENGYGVGSIRVVTAGLTSRGRPIFESFVGISNPYEVFKKIKEAAVDVKTDWSYPNALRPTTNPGYQTKYDPR